MENRVQQLRKSLGLSQRELASIVGTSQQQIQRIETGQIAARLELASKIANALQKPLNIVFPGATKALNDSIRENKVRSSLPEDAWVTMREIGLEGDPRFWTLKITLSGHDSAFFFEISAQEYNRLYPLLQQEDEGGRLKFVVFDTEKRRYAINLAEVAFYQFLFDFGGTLANDDEDEDHFGAEIFLRNQQSPILLEVEPDATEDADDQIGQCGHIFYMLETDPEPSHRYRIIDADGEHAFIRAGSIAIFSTPLSILESFTDEGDEESYTCSLTPSQK